MISPNLTIEFGRRWLSLRLRNGADCPLCGQHAQEYRRKINSGAARGLILMYQTYGTRWGHVPSTEGLSRLGGEFARLALWGLVEEATEKREDGGRAGWWRVTIRGRKFIYGEVEVPRYALVYNGQCRGHEGPLVGIRDALGTKFNYTELLAGV